MTPITDRPTTTYIFAGGGSGGHIFPGLAIAERLLEHTSNTNNNTSTNNHTTRCLFLCSGRAIDAKILEPIAQRATAKTSRLDTSTHGLWWEPTRAQPVTLRPLGLAKFILNWGTNIRDARHIIRQARTLGDVKVAAMGGFVAAPVAQAARVERVPTVLINLDAVPGKANRFIASRVNNIVTAAAGPRVPASWKPVGPIVRRAAIPPADQRTCRTILGFDPDRPVLMIVGASQGASSIDRFIAEAAANTGPAQTALKHWQILHQCGSDDSLNEAEQAYDALGIPAVLTRFVDTMGLWWGATDLAISRAGAGMVAEVLASRTPTVFMPYPFHRDQHQRHNAEPLIASGGAVLATDHIDPNENLQHHADLLARLLSNPDKLAGMRRSLAALAPPDGAANCAQLLRELPPNPPDDSPIHPTNTPSHA